MIRKINPKKLAIRLVVAYGLICLFMWGFQRHLLFLPQQGLSAPQAYGLQGFADARLPGTDGVMVQVWSHPAKEGYPTIIYFHGNGGNLANRAKFFSLLSDAGFGVVGLSYRGYGQSGGSPSEQGFYSDARTAIAYAGHVMNVSPEKLVLYGESIGTGVAVQMATEYKVAALVLQSPYTSIEARAADTYPWLPVSWLLKDRFDSLSKIERIQSPLLLFHGEKDGVVPVSDGRALFARAPMPKDAIYFPETGHINFNLQQLTADLLIFCRKNAIAPGG